MKQQWLAGRAARPCGCRRIHRHGRDRRRLGHDDVRNGRSRSFPYSISSANAGSVTASCRQWNPPYPEKAQAAVRMDLPVHSQTDTGKARKTIVKDARPVCAHVYYCSQLRLAVFMSCVSCLSPVLVSCPVAWSGQGASQARRRARWRRAPGGARPVAGGEARRLPGEAHASRPAGRRRENARGKRGAKRCCGCPYLDNSGR